VNPIETLSLALGAGFSSGLNFYATVATLGLLQRFGIVHLPTSLQVLAHPWVIGIAAGLYLIEFFADKLLTSTRSGTLFTRSSGRRPLERSETPDEIRFAASEPQQERSAARQAEKSLRSRSESCPLPRQFRE
jgi:Domain of unknown function (DUF4126)